MWETPQGFFDRYNKIYQFNTDVCAIKENAKCAHYYTPEQNGLIQSWKGVCWMNPPYGRNEGYKWVKKAYEENLKGCIVVALLPARTDTKWFHQFVINNPNVTIEFIEGRLKFSNSTDAAPFPSIVVTFGKKGKKTKLY